MKLNKLSTVLAVSALLATSSAMAWESEDGQHSTSASVALTSDYVWRGVTQTDNDPAISGAFDYAHSSGLYLGTWASNVSFATDADIEIDVYAGFGNDIGESGLSYDVGVLRYIYPGTIDSVSGDLDWTEYHVSAAYSYFSASINYGTDVIGVKGDDGFYYTLGFDYDLPYSVALSAGVGYSDVDSDAVGGDYDYADYHVGISKDLAGFGFDLTYTDTDLNNDEDPNDLADGRLIFTISKSM